MVPRITEVIGVQEAMDNLAAIASIDMESPPPIGIVRKSRLVTDEEEFGPGVVQWLSGEGSESIMSLLDATYRAVDHHLHDLYERAGVDWTKERSRKGIAAMMDLVGESARKMNRYLTHRLGNDYKGKVEDLEGFKALQRFYTERFAKKFEGGVEGEEAWEREWDENEMAPLLDLSKGSLGDFEAVRRDREYELFYIRNEDGKPYFTPELLRNIKLSADFDAQGESFEEDPLLKVRAMADRDLHASARQILGECHQAIEDFYKIAEKLSDHDLAQSLNMALTALFLAANPRNLLQNTTSKSALQYFEDFHRFLRRAMKTTEYQQLIAYPPERGDKSAQCLLFLTHYLCRCFFDRTGGVKQESIGLIHRSMRRGEEIQPKKVKGETIWNRFLAGDEKLRTLLAKFPNGPLFKILDVVRTAQEEDVIVPFDPISQENLPLSLYEMRRKEKKTRILRIPSPTRQSIINKVEIVDEFRGFLRGLAYGGRGEKHLIINLQDRTSWREYARSRAIESLQKNAEFNSHLFVMTLPKDTDFYYQNNEYLDLNKAEDFFASFKEQLAAPEECGFSFPSHWKSSEIARFTDSLLPLIHQYFFDKKNTLTRRNREDFIEIFYQFLILKAIDHIEPDSVCFTCKDAIDTGSAAAATFYGFLKLLGGDFAKNEEQDFLRWLLYTPALFIRERAVDPERFNRSISTLERLDGTLEEKREKIWKVFGEMYRDKFFSSLSVNHL